MKARHAKPSRARHVPLWLLTILAMVGTVLGVGATPASAATYYTLKPIVHTGTGRAINVLAVGDSYMAGNGGQDYYNATPDDPGIPSAYAGPGCYRSWGNASYRTYQFLGSKGLYINRACSGKLTSDVFPETSDLIATEPGKSIDLILLSAGGNDVNFADIAIHCILAPIKDLNTITAPGDGRKISENCYNLLNSLRSHVDDVLKAEEDNVRYLLTNFHNAKLILDGYPMLLDNRATPGGTADDGKVRATQSYTYDQLAEIMPDIARKQQAMINRINNDTSSYMAGRAAFNDVFNIFGGVDTNHGIFAKDPWVLSLTLPSTSTSVHPTPNGWYQIATGMYAQIKAKGWYGNIPVKTNPTKTFYYSPKISYGNNINGVVGGYNFTDGSSNFWSAPKKGFESLDGCSPGRTYNNVSAWAGLNHSIEWPSDGPDRINVICQNPRSGDIIKFARGSADTTTAYLAESASSTSIPKLHLITTGWMYSCKVHASGAKIFPISLSAFSYGLVGKSAPGESACVPKEWRNKVLAGPNGASYFVDAGGTKHHILSTGTFGYLTHTYGDAIRPSQQVDIDTIPTGADQPEHLDTVGLEGKIIRRSDGISWIIVGGQRRHITDYASDVCTQYRQGHAVAATGLSATLANTIPEGSAYSCSLSGSILRASDAADPKPSYTYHDGRRYHITDSWTFHAFQHLGWPVVDLPGGAIGRLADGGDETPRLDPVDVPTKSIIRRNDGVSWIVYDGVRHHIPYVQDDVCWRNLQGYPVVATGLSGAQANAIPEGNDAPCIIGDRIVKSSDGSSWYVDRTNTRHWIQDTATYGALAHSYAVVGPWPADDVNAIPRGSDMPHMLNPDDVRNTIIRRNDGVSWVVDGNGVRHHIPDAATDICSRWIRGIGVSRTNISGEQGNSLPEGGAYGCNADGYIFAANEGKSWWIDNNVRRSIQDVSSFYYYQARAHGVIRGISQAEVNGFSLGSAMPKK